MDNKKILIGAMVLACLMTLSISVWAGPKQLGEIFFARGFVTAAPEGQEVRFLGKGMPLFEGDIVTTGKRSFAVIHMSDGGKITLRPDTVFALEDYSPVRGRERSIFSLFKGGLRAVAGFIAKRNPRNGYRLKTPTAVVGIRGTEFDARICKGDCEADIKKVGRPSRVKRSPVAGRVVRLRGLLKARAEDGTERRLIKGGPVYQGDTLSTGSGDLAIVVFRDNSRVTLLGKSVFKVEKYQYRGKKGDNAFFRLLRGGLRTFTGLMARHAPKRFRVGTPTAVMGVRGTGFDVLITEEDRGAEQGKVAGRVVRLRGKLTVNTAEGRKGLLLRGSPVYEGDTLETGSRSMAVLVFRDNSRVTLQSETSFKVERYQYRAKKKDNIFFRMFRGGLRVFTGMVVRRNARAFKIGTPTAVVGVRGTGFDLLFGGKLLNKGQKGDGLLAYNWKESKHPIELNKDGKTTLLAPGKAGFAPKIGDAFKLPKVPPIIYENRDPKPDPKTVPADPDKLLVVKPGETVSVWEGVIELEHESGQKFEISEGKTLFWPKGAVNPIDKKLPPLPLIKDPLWRPDKDKVNIDDMFKVGDLKGKLDGLVVTVLDGHVTVKNDIDTKELGKGESCLVEALNKEIWRLDFQEWQVKDMDNILQMTKMKGESGMPRGKKECEIK